MDYKNNVYNVDESDVQDVEEFSEPVEEVEATVMDNSDFDFPERIDFKGMLFSVLALIFGGCSALTLLWFDFSFILCVTCAGTSGYFSFKYLFGGYHHKIFGKLALIGFLLSLAGLGFGIVKIVLLSMTSFGMTFMRALF